MVVLVVLQVPFPMLMVVVEHSMDMSNSFVAYMLVVVHTAGVAAPLIQGMNTVDEDMETKMTRQGVVPLYVYESESWF